MAFCAALPLEFLGYSTQPTTDEAPRLVPLLYRNETISVVQPCQRTRSNPGRHVFKLCLNLLGFDGVNETNDLLRASCLFVVAARLKVHCDVQYVEKHRQTKIC
jgi:hypothetical protein